MPDNGEEIALPMSIARAWGIPVHPKKGPKRGLSVERIAATAIMIALSEGLAAVSMHRVATDLGAGPMSLYRYVSSKDELLTLMIDIGLGAPSPTIEANDGWRAGLERWAKAIRGAYYQHPWALQIPISGPPISPNQVAWLEVGLRLLRDTSLTEAEKVSVIMLLSGFVRDEATLAVTISVASRASGTTPQATMAAYGRILARVADPLRFPAVHAAIASGALSNADEPDTEFAFGLERILDGIEALMRTRPERIR